MSVLKMRDAMSEIDLDELRSELEDYAAPEKAGGSSAREQRIIAGFEEIERFVEERGRLPRHGEHEDIFERLYAVRLDRLRASAECRAVLMDRDSRGLLKTGMDETWTGALREDEADYHVKSSSDAEPDDEELLSALREENTPSSDLRQLRHVRSREEIRTAEEVAKRNPCGDFEIFRPLFERMQQDLKAGVRKTLKYRDNAEVRKGDFFVLEGQMVVVAEMGEEFVSDYGRPDRRLRVVYDNGTESDLLVRSLQRALNKDKTSRRITEPDLGPLFSGEESEDDLESGWIYILRSKSTDPFVVQNRQVIHKIGVTGGEVKTRIANAAKDSTYLLAGVEIVSTFRLANIHRKQLEALLHKFFASARLDMELKDRFGFQVEPKEWFLLPLPVIEEAIRKLMDGTIGSFRYDPELARIVER